MEGFAIVVVVARTYERTDGTDGRKKRKERIDLFLRF